MEFIFFYQNDFRENFLLCASENMQIIFFQKYLHDTYNDIGKTIL